jgi:hypothetical protein
MTLCSDVVGYGCFGETCCLLLQERSGTNMKKETDFTRVAKITDVSEELHLLSLGSKRATTKKQEANCSNLSKW